MILKIIQYSAIHKANDIFTTQRRYNYHYIPIDLMHTCYVHGSQWNLKD